MADYISTLTGSQMDAALLDMAEHNSEAYAVGERNGVAVGEGDVTYHNNAKYYAQIATSTVPAGDIGDAVRWGVDQSTVLDASQKAQARENINAASDSDVVKITSQTLTSAEQAQARANIAAGGSNRNLLDNGWFTVRQRGDGAFTSGYTADRWTLQNNGASLSFSNNGMAVSLGSASYADIRHINEIGFAQALAGETVTISIKMADGTLFSGQMVMLASGMDANLYFTYNGKTIRINCYTTTTTFVFRALIYGDCAIRAMKMEKGSVSTLANDAPPDYGTELLKCMRYFIRLSAYNNENFGFGYAITAALGVIHLPLPVPMRATPTVSINGSFNLIGAGASRTVTAIGTPAIGVNGIQVQATSSSLTANQAYMLVSAANGTYIDLSADL